MTNKQSQRVIEDLYRTKREVLTAWVQRRYRLSREDAEDCVNDAVMRVWESRPQRPGISLIFASLWQRAVRLKHTRVREQMMRAEWGYSGFAVAKDCQCGRPIIEGGDSKDSCDACYRRKLRASERKKAA